jgi:hypothetical protein
MSSTAKNVCEQDKQREEGTRRGERNEEKAAHPPQKNGEDPDLVWIKMIDEAILAALSGQLVQRQANRLSDSNIIEREVSTMYPLAEDCQG